MLASSELLYRHSVLEAACVSEWCSGWCQPCVRHGSPDPAAAETSDLCGECLVVGVALVGLALCTYLHVSERWSLWVQVFFQLSSSHLVWTHQTGVTQTGRKPHSAGVPHMLIHTSFLCDDNNDIVYSTKRRRDWGVCVCVCVGVVASPSPDTPGTISRRAVGSTFFFLAHARGIRRYT